MPFSLLYTSSSYVSPIVVTFAAYIIRNDAFVPVVVESTNSNKRMTLPHAMTRGQRHRSHHSANFAGNKVEISVAHWLLVRHRVVETKRLRLIYV